MYAQVQGDLILSLSHSRNVNVHLHVNVVVPERIREGSAGCSTPLPTQACGMKPQRAQRYTEEAASGFTDLLLLYVVAFISLLNVFLNHNLCAPLSPLWFQSNMSELLRELAHADI